MSLPRIIVTGLMASGKSTVAQLLASRLPKSVHLRGDIYRKMIVNGREDMSLTPTANALEQLALRHALGRETARQYADAGFAVVYQDVILGNDLKGIVESFAPWKPGVVVLDPSLDVIAERDASRTKTAYGHAWSPASLDAALKQTPDIGLWIDTSALTADQTVDEIIRRSAEMRRGLGFPAILR